MVRRWSAAETEGETKATRENEKGGALCSGERMKNKPRGIGDKTAHWPRVRLTTLLVARPFLLASGQPGHSLPRAPGAAGLRAAITGLRREETRGRRGRGRKEGERNIPTFLSRGPGKLNSTREIERGNSTRFEPASLLRGAEF